MKRPQIGDLFEIPLSDGRKAIGQYVYFDRKNGPLIRIFNFFAPLDQAVVLDRINTAELLFPPVITGLFAAIRTGIWRIIGHLPVDDFQQPCFVSAFYDERSGNYGTWYLWDGTDYVALGKELPEKYQKLERLVVWHPNNIVMRIETGDNPYEYPRHGV
jgi:hypothetical protein